MSLMVTLFTFALAAYRFVAYRSIRRRLESELARQLKLSLDEGLRPSMHTMHTMQFLAARNAIDQLQSVEELRERVVVSQAFIRP